MSIVSSVIVLNKPNGSELDRRIREIHTDHLGGETVFNYTLLLNLSGNIVDSEGVILFDSLADKTAANAIIAESRLAEQEIQRWISEMGQGLDPWHTTPFVNVVPEFNTWLVATGASLYHWLLFTDRQQLLNCKLSFDNTSNSDRDAVLIEAGSSFSRTDLSSQLQIALDTQVDLDSYIPSVGD